MKKVHTVLKNNIFISLLITFISLFGILSVCSFKISYFTNDDLNISWLISEGYIPLFLNYFFAVFLIFVQKFFAQINIFMLSQVIANFIAMWIINYIFLKKFKLKQGIYFSIIAGILFSYYSYVAIQYTQTAAIITTTGYICVLYLCEKHHKFNAKILLGIFMVILGMAYRFQPFLSVSFVFLFSTFVNSVILLIREKTNKALPLKEKVLQCFKPFLMVLSVFVVCYLLNSCCNLLVRNDVDYVKHNKYQNSRSMCSDYAVQPYEGNTEFYNSIGIYSQNDVTMASSWYVDENFLTAERLEQIGTYSSIEIRFNKLEDFFFIFKSLNHKITNLFGSLSILVKILIILTLAGIGYVLFWYKNKIKNLFPFLFFLLWIFYFYHIWNYPFDNNPKLFIIIFIPFVLVISNLVNRYYFLFLCCISIMLFGLITYLCVTRINFRSLYTVIFPTAFLFLYYLEPTQIRYSLKIHKKYIKRILLIFLPVLTLFLSNQLKINIMSGYFYSNYANDTVFEYMQKHNANFYIINSQRVTDIFKNSNSALLKPQSTHNFISSDWYAYSKWYYDVCTQNNFTNGNIYQYLIDRKNTFFISQIDYRKMDTIKQYLYEHYAENIEFQVIDKIENSNYAVYKFVLQN